MYSFYMFLQSTFPCHCHWTLLTLKRFWFLLHVYGSHMFIVIVPFRCGIATSITYMLFFRCLLFGCWYRLSPLLIHVPDGFLVDHLQMLFKVVVFHKVFVTFFTIIVGLRGR